MFEESSKLGGLALDLANGCLYYTDKYLGIVGRIMTDGTKRRTLFANFAESPGTIIVDSVER